MDPRERHDSLSNLLTMALKGFQNELWTAMPGIIREFDPTTCTATIEVPVQIMFKLGNAEPTPYDIPPLLDVLVHFPSGGGYTLTFPVAAGDECLVVFASRCIDTWFETGKTGIPRYYRMHDLSDGFAFVGFRSLTRKLEEVATDAVQLRNDQKDTLLEIKNGGIINIISTASVNIETVNANITASGTATVKAASIILKNAGSALKKLVNDTFLTLFDAHTHISGGSGSPTSAPLSPSVASNKTTTVQAE